jgi:hypothetical protein
LKNLDEYYETLSDGTNVEWPNFASWFKYEKNYGMKKEKLDYYITLIERIDSTDAEVENGDEDEDGDSEIDPIIKHFVTMDYYTRLNDLTAKYLEGTSKIEVDELEELIDEFRETIGKASKTEDDPENFVPHDINDVLEATSLGSGLEWRLEELNVSCGPLRKGDFVEVAAYVDTGKTTFLASEATYMAAQLEPERVAVWVNNEEQGKKVRSRQYQATIGITERDILANPGFARSSYESILGRIDRIILIDDDQLSYKELSKIFEDLNPGLIIIDVLDKVKGFEGAARDDLRLQQLYQWARSSAKKYGPVIASSQVDGTAAGQRWIEMHQLQGSKVAKQGEADAIITIGRDNDPTSSMPNARYIHIPKNKLSGGTRSDEAERNGYWQVEIEPSIARYKGIVTKK